MKKVLLATSALMATAGFATAQGVSVSGTASIGVLGGGWIVDTSENHAGAGRNNASCTVGGTGPETKGINGCPIPGQSEFELHTDIDVTFTMSGQTDAGLTFGASIDLDESDGDGDRGESNAFGGRKQGGEEIFISGAFGTLTAGDTDGAFDWALQEIGIGGSVGDAHTSHAGYNGNDFADGVGDGQIARYDYSFGDFGVALSANVSDEAAHDDVLAVGAKYNVSLDAMELGLGVGYSQLGNDSAKDDAALGVSLDANFNNGFRAILNWVDLGDMAGDDDTDDDAEQYMGLGLGYTLDDWTFAINYGQYTEDEPGTEDDPGQSGYAVVVNYDLGGGAQVQFGYSKSICEMNPQNTGDTDTVPDPVYAGANCDTGTGENSALSLGVAMSF